MNLFTILGPTASGKTGFAAHLAYELNGEIISGDSRQVYKGMNIGTGKDYGDYLISGDQIAVHLIDIHDPGYKYNVYEFQNDFNRVLPGITGRGKLPILVGGTGLYLQAVLENYELIRVPVNTELRHHLQDKPMEELVGILKTYKNNLHNTTDILHRKRTVRAIEIADYYANYHMEKQAIPEIKSFIIGIKFERQTQKRRITDRLYQRLENGMVEEVKSLLEKIDMEDLIYYGLEYKYITLYLTGKMDYDDMVKKLEIAIHQFSKRQMTWFRRMERNGYNIHWINGELKLREKINSVKKLLSRNS